MTELLQGATVSLEATLRHRGPAHSSQVSDLWIAPFDGLAHGQVRSEGVVKHLPISLNRFQVPQRYR